MVPQNLRKNSPSIRVVQLRVDTLYLRTRCESDSVADAITLCSFLFGASTRSPLELCSFYIFLNLCRLCKLRLLLLNSCNLFFARVNDSFLRYETRVLT